MVLLQTEPFIAFKNIAEAVHYIFIVIALIIGGIWTLYTFSSLGAKKKAELELYEQAVINIEISCKHENINQQNEIYIHGIVKIENKGNRNTFLDFRKIPSFQISKLVFDANGNSLVAYTFNQNNLLLPYLVLRQGAFSTHPFVMKVTEKGFYMVTFKVAVNNTEHILFKDAGGVSSTSCWTGSTCMMVS